MLDALTLVLAATEGHGSSKTAFYIAGAVLAVFAVIVAVIGIKRIDSFPASKGQARGVIGLAALLVVAAMATSILTS